MTEYYIRLGYALGAGNIRVKRALEYFGNAENIFKASDKERAESGIFTKNELLRIKNSQNATAFETLEECKENGIDIICYGDKNYPYCLSVTEDAPALLYVKGTMPDFDNIPAVCIVGPRKVTEKGKMASYSIARRLALSGMTVVSGGALGCDSAAHSGALKVLPCLLWAAVF